MKSQFKKLLRPLLKLVRSLKAKSFVLRMKYRARKLGVQYHEGVHLGKRIRRTDGTTIVINKGVWIANDCLFWGGGTVTLGENTHLGEGSRIFASPESAGGGVIFGNDVNCATGLYVIDCDHGFRGEGLIRKQPMVVKRIVIGNDIWIAAHVTILKGTTIGDRSVVGACALCNKQYPPHSVIGGVPGKVIGSTAK